MKNYGESLVYWYFRLNGFIPMVDFVLHGDKKKKRKPSDCDLVAVRFPHVSEVVGGQENDWDGVRLREMGHDGERAIGVLVQVKTGDDDAHRAGDIASYFEKHLDYLVKRLGFWPNVDAAIVVEKLRNQAVVHHKGYTLSKVVILRKLPRRQKIWPWLEWRLQDLLRFIYGRMNRYKSEKFTDRMFFPDPIMQLFAEQAFQPEFRWPAE